MLNKKIINSIILFTFILFSLLFCTIKVYALDNTYALDFNVISSEKEIISERDEYTKKYTNDDGSTTAEVYAFPIHYKDENGNWKDINNLLKLNDNYYTNEDNPLKIILSKSSSDEKIVSIIDGDYEMSWNIVNIMTVDAKINNTSKNSNLDKLTSEATYSNVFKNTSLKYTLSSYSLMEETIFTDVPEYENIIYNVKCKNLKAKLVNKEIIFYSNDANEKEIFKFSTPYMYDSATKPQIDMNIEVSLEESSDGYIVTHKLDMDWLKSKDRIYPVILDPTVTSYQHYSNIEDTHTNSNNPNTNYVNNPYLQIGKINGDNYIYVKITNLPNIPAGATINNASLGLYLNYGSSTWGALSIYELRNQMDSYGLTWNNQWTLVNNSGYLSSGIYPSYTGGYYKYNIDVTSTYQKWYNGQLGNYGFMLRYQDLNYNDCNWIYSSDNLGIGSTYLPAITVNYTGGVNYYRNLNWFYPIPSNYTNITNGWTGNHQAIDIYVPVGQPLYAPQNGVVSSVLTVSMGYTIGNAIAIRTTDLDQITNNNLVVSFGHLSSILVSNGQNVTKGQLIGYTGMTGNPSGPHIHIEVSKNGQNWSDHLPSSAGNTLDPTQFWFNQ